MIPAPPSLLVFADDWDRHPSSCQHLVRQMLPAVATCWVNTIGTRTPGLDIATLRRGAEKLRQWSGGGSSSPSSTNALPANLRVLSPAMWPWFGGHVAHSVNRELLLRQLSAAVEALPSPPIAVTTVPIVADLLGRLPRVRRWVYYCVDDFGSWPGLDGKTLDELERRVVRPADVIVAASDPLRGRISAMGRHAHLLTHGVDLDFWQPPGMDECPQLAGLERPLVVFWGVIDRRMDMSFVRRLAADMTRGTIVLVGPTADPDPALAAVPRVAAIGKVRLDRLPHVARHAAVLVMPYADLPVTRAMQPLKLKEYLATGKPVVARALPATQPWDNFLDLADSPESFSRAVLRRLDGVCPEAQRVARTRLGDESWQAKANQFAKWVFDRGEIEQSGVSLAG